MFFKKGVLENFAKFTGKYLSQSLFFNRETLAQVFSCGFCEIFKNTFFHRIPPVAACVNGILSGGSHMTKRSGISSDFLTRPLKFRGLF